MKLRIFVKKQTTKDGKEFKVASYISPIGEWYKVKFTQDSGVSLAKLNQGYYDISFAPALYSIQTKHITKGDKSFDENIIWIDDDETVIEEHKETKEEEAERIARNNSRLLGE